MQFRNEAINDGQADKSSLLWLILDAGDDEEEEVSSEEH